MDAKKIGFAVVTGVLLLWFIGQTISPSKKAEPPQTVQAAPTDKWHVSLKKSPMDDSKTVVLALDSDDEIEGPVGKTRPTLIVRCLEQKTTVYVETGMAASVEQGPDAEPRDAHDVRIRFDDDPARYYAWEESTDHKALFAGDLIFDGSGNVTAFSGGTIELAKRIVRANTLTFQFTPFDGSPQVARFDVRGLDPYLHKLAEACGWAY